MPPLSKPLGPRKDGNVPSAHGLTCVSPNLFVKASATSLIRRTMTIVTSLIPRPKVAASTPPTTRARSNSRKRRNQKKNNMLALCKEAKCAKRALRKCLELVAIVYTECGTGALICENCRGRRCMRGVLYTFSLKACSILFERSPTSASLVALISHELNAHVSDLVHLRTSCDQCYAPYYVAEALVRARAHGESHWRRHARTVSLNDCCCSSGRFTTP